MADLTCPECDAPLVFKDVKGKKFYGCTRFPNCKATFPVDEGGGPDLDKSAFPVRTIKRRIAQKGQIER